MEIGISPFSKAEYLTIFIAFVYGYVANEFFKGWGRIIRGKDRSPICGFHLAWSLLVFGILIDFWWSSWERSEKLSSHIGYFSISLMPALIFYVVGVVLFPMKLGLRKFNTKEYFTNIFPLFLGLMMLLFASNILTDLIYNKFYFFTTNNTFRIIAIILAGIGILIKKQFMYNIILLLGWTVLVSHYFII